MAFSKQSKIVWVLKEKQKLKAEMLAHAPAQCRRCDKMDENLNQKVFDGMFWKMQFFGFGWPRECKSCYVMKTGEGKKQVGEPVL